MDQVDSFSPREFYGSELTGRPRVFIAPQRYIQGNGVLDDAGHYLSLVPRDHVAVLISGRGKDSPVGVRLLNSLRGEGIEYSIGVFNGEVTQGEINKQVELLRAAGPTSLMAVGGGKCIDTGKAVAHRLGVPLVVVPTLASNDAPCSSVTVLYAPDGASSGIEFYRQPPAMVLVDTGVVAAAPERFLVAGMGDAMATWYEARSTLANGGITVAGGAPTLAAAAIGEQCASTLFAHGVAAAASVAKGEVSEAVEMVVEANTLLSGIGFESGGLAAAHPIAQAFTNIPGSHANHLHGEMVAFGTLTQLVMEGLEDEAARVAEFFCEVGLPSHLQHLSVGRADEGAVEILVIESVSAIGNMERIFSADEVRTAILSADEIGRRVTDRVGDAPYRRLHG
jgi:glycerol dehydrogenase